MRAALAEAEAAGQARSCPSALSSSWMGRLSRADGRRHIKTYLGGMLEPEAHDTMRRYDPRMLACLTTGRLP